jgi:arabinose-5-phosphate isomerase
MKSLLPTTDHVSTVKDVLEVEAKAILNMVDLVQDDIAHTIEMILACKGRVIVTGVGKSGIIGKKITATLASTGTPALFLHPAEGLHGDLGMVTSSDIVLALSKSGESEEVINIVPSIKRIGSKLIAFVGNENSTLASFADRIISIGNVEEVCPLGLAPTTSTTLMLTLGDAIAIALLKARNFTQDDFAIYHPGGSLGKRILFNVHAVMKQTKKNPILKDISTVRDAIFNMTDSGLGAASIVNEYGKLVGIITDGDIRRALAEGENFMNMTIEHLFNQNPITVQGNQLAVEALTIMENKKINVLPVVNDGNEPIAMIHLHDLTKLGL